MQTLLLLCLCADPGETPYLQPALLGEEGKRQRTPPAHCAASRCVDDAVVQLVVTPHKSSYLASSQEAPEACERLQHAAAGEQAQWEGDGDGGQASLFSPHFHLHKEGDGPEDACGIGACEAVTLEAAGAAAAQHSSGAALSLPVASPAVCEALPCDIVAPAAVEADCTSTDHSTGTSASLDGSASEASETGEAASGSAAAVACAAAVAVAAPPPSCGSCPEDECDVDECLEFDPLLFIKRLPPLERCMPPRREFLLPK
jgi:hypothetical protein